MTILRSGASRKYADNWAAAFGKKTAKTKAAKTKTAKAKKAKTKPPAKAKKKAKSKR